jgi:hypothetical protein
MSMNTNTLMNINTNMIIPLHRMNMAMSTSVNTDRMIMIIPGTRQKNIHTSINSLLFKHLKKIGSGVGKMAYTKRSSGFANLCFSNR